MVSRQVPSGLFTMMSSIDPVIRPLIPMFLEQTLLRIQSLEDALLKSDFVTIKRLAHTMKGSSSSYGFGEMADIARSIEAELQLEHVDPENLSVLIGKLMTLHSAAEGVVSENKHLFQDDQE